MESRKRKAERMNEELSRKMARIEEDRKKKAKQKERKKEEDNCKL